MPKSLAHGDYSLLMAVESASRPDSWYRVLSDRTTHELSCDCPAWTFNQRGNRTCSHTDFMAPLIATEGHELVPLHTSVQAATNAPLIEATQRQWPGLYGTWSLEQRRGAIKNKAYQLVRLRLSLGNGGTAMGWIAFAERHHPTQERISSRVAGWAGYAVAAEVARLGGYPLAGQPPEHFSIMRRAGRTTATQRAVPQIGLLDILRVADQTDLGDGLKPAQRAENTLRLFLGESVYAQLEYNHFLDVSSVRYAEDQRVYRLRRDPRKTRERRVRVFERGRYTKDFCIVRGMDCPEADHFLTCFLGLMSDEMHILSVVQSYNIFSPCSDGQEQETIPARWQGREAVAI